MGAITVPQLIIDKGVTSIAVGTTLPGEFSDCPLRARIDRLEFAADLGNGKRHRMLSAALGSLEATSTYQVSHRKIKEKRKGEKVFYTRAVAIRRFDDPKARLMIEYMPPEGAKRAYFKFTISPQFFGPRKISTLFNWLAESDRLGIAIFRLLKTAWIKRVDFALDIYHLRCRDVHFRMNRLGVGKTHDNPYDFDGFRLGTARSYLTLVGYEKLESESGHKGHRDDQLVEVEVEADDCERFLRLEFRVRPDVKRTGILPLCDIWHLDNPMDGLFIYSRDLEDDPSLPEAFRNALKEGKTMSEAVAALRKGEGDIGSQQRQIDRVRRKYLLKLIDKQAVWGEWDSCVKKLGVLGDRTVWTRKLRKTKIGKTP